jgi:hypothetical protein
VVVEDGKPKIKAGPRKCPDDHERR